MQTMSTSKDGQPWTPSCSLESLHSIRYLRALVENIAHRAHLPREEAEVFIRDVAEFVEARCGLLREEVRTEQARAAQLQNKYSRLLKESTDLGSEYVY